MNTPAWRAKGIERNDVDQSCHNLFSDIVAVPQDSCGRNLVPRHFRLLSLRAMSGCRHEYTLGTNESGSNIPQRPFVRRRGNGDESNSCQIHRRRGADERRLVHGWYRCGRTSWVNVVIVLIMWTYLGLHVVDDTRELAQLPPGPSCSTNQQVCVHIWSWFGLHELLQSPIWRLWRVSCSKQCLFLDQWWWEKLQ